MTHQEKAAVLELLREIYGNYDFVDKFDFLDSIQNAIQLVRNRNVDEQRAHQPDKGNRKEAIHQG